MKKARARCTAREFRTIFAEDLGDLSGVDPAAEHVVEAGRARRDLKRRGTGVRSSDVARKKRARARETHLEHILSLVLDLERRLDLEPPEAAVAPEDLERAVSDLEIFRSERGVSRSARESARLTFSMRASLIPLIACSSFEVRLRMVPMVVTPASTSLLISFWLTPIFSSIWTAARKHNLRGARHFATKRERRGRT